MTHMTSLDARMLLMAGHFVATCMTVASRGSELGVAFLLFASFALAFASIIGGWELFVPKNNALHAVAHFVGGLMQARIVLYDLPEASYLWYVVLLAHAPATAATLNSFVRLFVFPHASRA